MEFSENSPEIILKLENIHLVDRSNPKVKTNGILNLTSSFVFFVENGSQNELCVYNTIIRFIFKRKNENFLQNFCFLKRFSIHLYFLSKNNH
jgi:hypothetical protein